MGIMLKQKFLRILNLHSKIAKIFLVLIILGSANNFLIPIAWSQTVPEDSDSGDGPGNFPGTLSFVETCTASALNRSIDFKPGFPFEISNLPVPDGFYRIRVICETSEGNVLGQTELLQGVPNGTTFFSGITYNDVAPVPVSILLAATPTTLTATVTTTQITTTGTLADASTLDMTPSATGTFYSSSNPAIATVSADGLVVAVASGSVFITARNEGAVATIPIQVVLSDDADGDGLADPFFIEKVGFLSNYEFSATR